jgi:presenilin-like A22 family membrane protease
MMQVIQYTSFMLTSAQKVVKQTVPLSITVPYPLSFSLAQKKNENKTCGAHATLARPKSILLFLAVND